MKRVALLGSSGGNLHRLGGSDPAALIRAVQDQVARAGVELVAVCFVSAAKSLDSGGAGSTGTLWRLDEGAPRPVTAGLLDEVNDYARAEDQAIADLIDEGHIDGLILVSSDPGGTNKASIQAAASRSLPVAGSGGSSIAAAEAMGVRFVAASGTTGTTNHTRAIGYATGFAREWGLRYRPVDLATSPAAFCRRYDPRPILVDALPVLLAVAAIIGVSRHLGAATSAEASRLLLPLVPVTVAFIAAARSCGVGQAGMLAGIAAGALAGHAGLLGALVAGFLAGTLADVFVSIALRSRWPATTANIIGSGGAGLAAGALVRYGLGEPGRAVDRWIAHLVASGLDHAGLLIGAAAGLLMWPVLLRGLYHSLVLPLIVVEISHSGLSFLAAMDMVTLVAVSCGIAAGCIVAPRRAEDRKPARHTFAINFAFGTYVEGSFPHVKSGRAYLILACLAGGAGGAIAGAHSGFGGTYLPLVALPIVGSAPLGLGLALTVSFGVAFLGTALLNKATRAGKLCSLPSPGERSQERLQ